MHNAETVDSGERFIQLLAVKSARKLMGQSCQGLCCCAWTMEWQLCLPRASTTHRPQPANICGASTLMQLAHALAAACAQPARLHRAPSALSRPSPPSNRLGWVDSYSLSNKPSRPHPIIGGFSFSESCEELAVDERPRAELELRNSWRRWRRSRHGLRGHEPSTRRGGQRLLLCAQA